VHRHCSQIRKNPCLVTSSIAVLLALDMTTIHRSCLTLGLLTLVACAGNPAIPEQAPPPASALPPAPAETTKSSEPPKVPEPQAEKSAAPTPVWRLTEGVSTPESVLYDEANDRYLVSNINGKPDEADNNGFIMEVSPDGKVTKPKFIAGGEGRVKLDAPKGTALAGGILYVSDITVVRKFDAKTGAPKGEIPIPGSTFLNDIAIAKDGQVFVSDSGVKVGPKGFEPTGTDAVYVIDKGKLKIVAKAKDLAGPNGLLPVDNGVLVVALTGDELYRLDDKGARQDITKLPNGGLDGIVSVGDSLLVTSWGASAIYRGTLGGKFEVAYAELKGPADIAFDSKRKRVLVPRFVDNAIEAYDLK
jgi:sugar lactone lactonase YvrE